MQDRFKFRCWDDYNREMLDLQEQDTNPYNISDFAQHNIMQCTGLKDKNGKLIYELDIVKINDYNRPIEVRFKGLGFELYRSPDNLVGYHNDKYFPESIEVIGNIYENPELLEG